MFGGSDWNFGIGGYPAYSAPIIGAYPYSTSKFYFFRKVINLGQFFWIEILPLIFLVTLKNPQKNRR